MPELPEVEAARALIEAHALGRPIAAVDDRDTYVCRPHGVGELSDALVGRTLTRARRIGKSMWVETDEGEGPSLGLHLGMAGRMVFISEDVSAGTSYAGDPMSATELAGEAGGHPDPRSSGNPAWARFTVEFEDGAALILFDKRRLGRAVLNPDLSGLGPDALEVPRAVFAERVGAGTAPLKARIMDQSVIAGVGNLLADETLWQAGLSPLRPAGELTDEERAHLWRTLRRCTRAAIKHGGVHTGRFIPYRRRGAACPRCGTEPVRATVGGRTTWWCPEEQT
ncbi:Fpg/Nei family DNA glycosylase [Paraconexibacter algicola]|uniref:Formamidopyrimidine-DNA glycosylase n=1 Tax=Paraconexibacter algicola TaxID=2133960 RepID=A0A2T4UDR0_9ACTN|nr:DNA-formamidopyrimidine glycosylase family protein [Paraconexibacter algicola]PTL55640.1 formamidopyrimidine-DNA glycosylase [Paraconexibacter algicola]